MAHSKKIQLYRNGTVIRPDAEHGKTAYEVAKETFTTLTNVGDGEMVLARYKEGDNDQVKTVIGVYHIENSTGSWTYLSESKPLIVTLSYNESNETYSSDTSNAEIYAAWKDEREVICVGNDGEIYQPLLIGAQSAYFAQQSFEDSYSRYDVSIVTNNNSQIVTLSYTEYGGSLTFDSAPTANSTNPVTSGGVYTALGGKVDTVSGKGLSTNDYTTTEKNKLAGIAAGAEVNVQADWNQTTDTADDYIKNKPNLATVATSGSYNDLSNKPTIPSTAAGVNADVLVVNFSYDESDDIVCDKTNAEIYSAWQDGRNVIGNILDDYIYPISQVNATCATFCGIPYDVLQSNDSVMVYTTNNVQTVERSSMSLQQVLSSGTNIKTINNNSILGSGNLTPSQLGVPSIANNLTTTTAGSVLDATQGKALNDKLPLVVTLTSTISNNETTYSADKTYAEINTAKTNGRLIALKAENGMYAYADTYDSAHHFVMAFDGAFFGFAVNSSDVWSEENVMLSTVATSGSYNDLTEKPSIPKISYGQMTSNGFKPATYGQVGNDWRWQISQIPVTPDVYTLYVDVFDGETYHYNGTAYKRLDDDLPLIVTLTWNTSTSSYSADKTYSVINNAYNAGLPVVVNRDDGLYRMLGYWDSKYHFGVAIEGHFYGFSVDSSNVWEEENTTPQANWNEVDSTSPEYIKNKPTIPAAQVQANWNETSVLSMAYIQNKPNLATVATSGSYNDLSDKPTIPAAQVNADWSASSGVAQILNKPTLATVATSGAYSDLSGIPSVVTRLDSGDVTFALSPNTFYRFTGTLTSLDLTLTAGTGLCIYAGKFTASSNWGGNGLTIPSTVTQAMNNDTVSAGGTYEFSILDNVMILKQIS